MPDRADEGFGMQDCLFLTNRLRRSPLSHRRGLSSLILDSATSPFGFVQNDKGEFSEDGDILSRESYTYPV